MDIINFCARDAKAMCFFQLDWPLSITKTDNNFRSDDKCKVKHALRLDFWQFEHYRLQIAITCCAKFSLKQ